MSILSDMYITNASEYPEPEAVQAVKQAFEGLPGYVDVTSHILSYDEYDGNARPLNNRGDETVLILVAKIPSYGEDVVKPLREVVNTIHAEREKQRLEGERKRLESEQTQLEA